MAKVNFGDRLKAEKEEAAAAFISQMEKATGGSEGEFPRESGAGNNKAAGARNKKRPTERLNLTLPTDLKADLHIMAAIERRAVNHIINDAVGAYLEKNRSKIEQYKELFGEGAEQ